MSEKIKDVHTSIHARLLAKAKGQNRPFNEILQYYAMERWLFRLSKTAYAEKFLLKGGLLLYGWNIPLRRPTKDIDFRGYVSNSEESIFEFIKSVCSQSMPEDGLDFDITTLKLTDTQVDADYLGMRANFTGHLGKSRIHMQIDIGFSDQVTPGAIELVYPSTLPSMPGTKLKGCPPETVISEKYHVMVHLGEINSRMKDYYDIWLLAKSFEFKRQVLHQAIVNTFKNRSTDLPAERPQALSREFAMQNQKTWGIFLKKNGIENVEAADFPQVVEEIWNFLALPTLEALPNKAPKPDRWIPGKGWV